MSNIFLISDTHFSHANVLKFKNNLGEPIRPGFDSIEHMDETLIENWNKVVTSEDKIYHLGDITFSQAAFDKIMPRLNGKKRLILGNHDNLNMGAYAKYFQKIMSWRSFNNFEVPFVMCHYPLHQQSFNYRSGNPAFCVHGHLHNRVVMIDNTNKPDPRYISVCVEQINYTPVSIDDMLVRMKKIK